MMLHSLPEPDSFEELPQPASHQWSGFDLAVFAVFFGLTVLFLPLLFVRAVQVFQPEMRLTDLSGVEQVILQGVMDLILVGFIVFLVRNVHRRSFVETIHWFRNYQISTKYLIAAGVALAISVVVASSFFPPKEPPPIEKLISSSHSLYVFALFGIGFAPLLEEIIFRGFLFEVISDLGGPRWAVPTTAGLFALLHVPQLWGSWAGVLLILVVGFVLSGARNRTNSLIPGLIIHMSYNAMLFGIFALSFLGGSHA